METHNFIFDSLIVNFKSALAINEALPLRLPGGGGGRGDRGGRGGRGGRGRNLGTKAKKMIKGSSGIVAASLLSALRHLGFEHAANYLAEEYSPEMLAVMTIGSIVGSVLGLLGVMFAFCRYFKRKSGGTERKLVDILELIEMEHLRNRNHQAAN